MLPRPLFRRTTKTSLLIVGSTMLLGGIVLGLVRCSPTLHPQTRCFDRPVGGAIARTLIIGGLGLDLVGLLFIASDSERARARRMRR